MTSKFVVSIQLFTGLGDFCSIANAKHNCDPAKSDIKKYPEIKLELKNKRCLKENY